MSDKSAECNLPRKALYKTPNFSKALNLTFFLVKKLFDILIVLIIEGLINLFKLLNDTYCFLSFTITQNLRKKYVTNQSAFLILAFFKVNPVIIPDQA
jgi:hypothetical protein